MFNLFKCFLVSMISMVLTSCALTPFIYGEKGLIKDRDTEYLKAYSIEPLKFPPGVTPCIIHPQYPIPTMCYPDNTKRVQIMPPELIH